MIDIYFITQVLFLLLINLKENHQGVHQNILDRQE